MYQPRKKGLYRARVANLNEVLRRERGQEAAIKRMVAQAALTAAQYQATADAAMRGMLKLMG